MEKQFNIRHIFGLSQIEMAMLLKISRARYSMYESGKRSLPLEATQRLAKMLEQNNAIEAGDYKKLPHVELQQAKAKEEVEAMLKENEYQLYTVTQNLAALQRKHDAHTKALLLVDRLDTVPEFKTAPSFLNLIKSTAEKGVEHSRLSKLIKLRVRLATLKNERKEIQAEMENVIAL